MTTPRLLFYCPCDNPLTFVALVTTLRLFFCCPNNNPLKCVALMPASLLAVFPPTLMNDLSALLAVLGLSAHTEEMHVSCEGCS